MPRFLLFFALILPSLGAFLYFVVLSSSPWANEVYAGVKVAMIVIALVGLRYSRRSTRQMLRFSTKDLFQGILSGILIAAVLFIGFFLLHGSLTPYGILIQTKVTSLFPLALYIPVAILFSLFHAFFEEWYWRGYVYQEMQSLFRPSSALVLGSLAFTAHHVIVLSQMFSGMLTMLFSIAIFFASVFWAMLLRRTGSLIAPWISHVFADATFFLCGYWLMEKTF